jgi:hypothetical protein
MWKTDPKINTYAKQTCSYTNSAVEHVCNRGTALWNSGKKGKEKRSDRESVISHTTRREDRGYEDVY